MRHAVLGNGNLGNAIAKEVLKNNKNEFKLFSTTTGWKYPRDGIQDILDYMPDHVWVTVGAGSVEQAKDQYDLFADLHIRLPMQLAQNLKENVVLHLFSTDYCCTPTPQSLYALSKKHMEESIALLNLTGYMLNKVNVYRVGSLYGTHKPQKCFPYKLKKNFSLGKEIELPENCISPTPVDWLAEHLLYLNENSCVTSCSNPAVFEVRLICPSGCTTVKNWGELILGTEVKSKYLDISRPTKCFHGNCDNSLPSWLELWEERQRPSMGCPVNYSPCGVCGSEG